MPRALCLVPRFGPRIAQAEKGPSRQPASPTRHETQGTMHLVRSTTQPVVDVTLVFRDVPIVILEGQIAIGVVFAPLYLLDLQRPVAHKIVSPAIGLLTLLRILGEYVGDMGNKRRSQ